MGEEFQGGHEKHLPHCVRVVLECSVDESIVTRYMNVRDYRDALLMISYIHS